MRNNNRMYIGARAMGEFSRTTKNNTKHREPEEITAGLAEFVLLRMRNEVNSLRYNNTVSADTK